MKVVMLMYGSAENDLVLDLLPNCLLVVLAAVRSQEIEGRYVILHVHETPDHGHQQCRGDSVSPFCPGGR